MAFSAYDSIIAALADGNKEDVESSLLPAASAAMMLSYAENAIEKG